jgi:hypothetical protein
MNEVICDFRFAICDLRLETTGLCVWFLVYGLNRKSKIKNRKSCPSHSRDAEFPAVIPFAWVTALALCQIEL